MKICIPVSGGNGLDEVNFAHFGSAEYFAIYDTSNRSIETVPNKNLHHEHGMCQPLAVIAPYDVEAVLTGGMGKRAVALMNQGGIRVYMLAGGSVQEAVDKFERGELEELTIENACGGHGHAAMHGHG
jgi:predicted Fe-Mo cluster-binding NifX family protein